MTIDNNELFADLEAAADSNDDSELSLDDLMDMEIVDDDQHVHDHVQQYHRQQHDNFMLAINSSESSGIPNEYEFLNKSTTTAATALIDDFDIDNDEDIDMMSHCHDDDNYNIMYGHVHSSHVTSKATMPFGSISAPPAYVNSSPTSVIAYQQHMAPLPPPLVTGSSMSSASTRHALNQMRKMMTELMNSNTNNGNNGNGNGNGNVTSHHDSRLPCAKGMDEMYLDTLRKLSASMARTKKSRKSLSIPIQTTTSTMQLHNNTSSSNSNSINTHFVPQQQQHQEYCYDRSMCVNQILQSVQTSTQQVDKCLQNVRMMSSIR